MSQDRRRTQRASANAVGSLPTGSTATTGRPFNVVLTLGIANQLLLLVLLLLEVNLILVGLGFLLNAGAVLAFVLAHSSELDRARAREVSCI